MIFAENMKSHIKAVQDLGTGVNKFVKEIKDLKDAVQKMQEERK